MGLQRSLRRFLSRYLIAFITAGCLIGLSVRHYLSAQGNQGFRGGYDAVRVAPENHRVLFDNAFVRVLHVTPPAPGVTEPMHHHPWPSLFLNWEKDGRTAHMRYHTPDGKVVDMPGQERPFTSGRWTARWIEPEPMHAVEVVEEGTAVEERVPGAIRVEVKFVPN